MDNLQSLKYFDEKLFEVLHETTKQNIIDKPPNKLYIYLNNPVKIISYYNDLDNDNESVLLICIFDLSYLTIRQLHVSYTDVLDTINIWNKFINLPAEVDSKLIEYNCLKTMTLRQFVECDIYLLFSDNWLQKSINIEHSSKYLTDYFFK